jgi:hypothetical protein
MVGTVKLLIFKTGKMDGFSDNLGGYKVVKRRRFCCRLINGDYRLLNKNLPTLFLKYFYYGIQKFQLMLKAHPLTTVGRIY